MFKSNAIYYLKSTINVSDTTGDIFNISTDFELGENLETGTDTVSIVLKNSVQIERMTITATGGVATIVERGLTQGDTKVEDGALNKQWTDGTYIYVTALASDMLDIDISNGTAVINTDIDFSGSITHSGTMQLPTFANAGARDAVYTSPTNGDKCFVTGVGEQYYSGGIWNTLGTSTPTPDASETVAGKVEIATYQQVIDGIYTGDTGAVLVAAPTHIGRTNQSATYIFANATNLTDTYTIDLIPTPIAYTTGMKIRVKFTTANTGACTINVNSLGAKDIKTLGGNDPQSGDIAAGGIRELIYDGTNFILLDTKATTSEKGLVEGATDTEVYTGTDTERYINPKQAKDNYGKVSAFSSTFESTSRMNISTNASGTGGLDTVEKLGARVDGVGSTNSGAAIKYNIGFAPLINNSIIHIAGKFTTNNAGNGDIGYMGLGGSVYNTTSFDLNTNHIGIFAERASATNTLYFTVGNGVSETRTAILSGYTSGQVYEFYIKVISTTSLKIAYKTSGASSRSAETEITTNIPVFSTLSVFEIDYITPGAFGGNVTCSSLSILTS